MSAKFPRGVGEQTHSQPSVYFLSVRCGLVITSWKRVDLLVSFCVMFACVLTLSHMVSRVG